MEDSIIYDGYLFNANNSDYGSITFKTHEYGEVISIKKNGDIYIHGKLVTNDMEVVEGFKKFLRMI